MMLKSVASLLALGSCAAGLNILLTNDDSWASANIRYASTTRSLSPPLTSYTLNRATYTALKADGHDVLLVG